VEGRAETVVKNEVTSDGMHSLILWKEHHLNSFPVAENEVKSDGMYSS
jgi:hypothetical protein